jgi:hypothetical protein
MVVLCPTRGRVDNAYEVLRSFRATVSAKLDSQLVLVVDRDDPKFVDYAPLRREAKVHVYSPEHSGGMVAALNAAAPMAIEKLDAEHLGFVGDDHRFRSLEWDEVFVGHLEGRGGGFAYGNDRFWHKGEIPTQIFMSARIVTALGWMALPTCRHLYVDNAWRVMGDALERLFWFPNVIIEHMHPAVGKAAWDAMYRANNSEERYAADKAAFETWHASPQFEEDVERVRRSLAGAAAG